MFPTTITRIEEYTFRTRTKADGGALRSLVIGDDGANPQPRVRVGVVTAGKGQLDVSPVVYESETDRNISTRLYRPRGPCMITLLTALRSTVG